MFSYGLSIVNYNLKHSKVLHYIATILSNISITVDRYPIRHLRLQHPFRTHEDI